MIIDLEEYPSVLNKNITNLFILLFVVSNLYGSSKSIKGIILDSETNQAIPNVVIKIIEISKSFTCNDEGEFNLNEFDYGTYTFVLNHIGYLENISKVKIDQSSNKLIAFYLIPRNIELDPVIVSDYKSYSKFDDLSELSNVLKGKELQKQLGLTLASTLKNEAGIAMRSMGPAPSRPVIRGLGSNRVLISEDGIKTTDLSATSPDHAVTIDPFTISRIEVLRGPKVLTQSSTTIGGVVNVVRDEIPDKIHDNLIGQVGLFGESVNMGYLGSLMLELPLSPFVVKGEISRRKTEDLYTPTGNLKNSNSENTNFSLASSYIFENGFLGASYRRFELDYGVPGGFVGAHPNGVNIGIYKNQYNIKSKLKLDDYTDDNLEFSFTRVFYRHKEFESSGAIGSEFELINFISDLKLNHSQISIFENGVVGASMEHRDFDIGGFVFTSPSKSLNISSYLIENIAYKKISLEMGARYNYDKITPITEKISEKIGRIEERNFNTYSLSLSILYAQSKYVYFGANISKSSRVPTIEELFSEGPHLAAYSYEIGNPYLNAESGFGGELFIYHQFEDLYFNLTFFRNDLDNYIIPRNSGEINFATFLPIYKTEGVSALLYGFENRIDWSICRHFQVSNTVSFTRGKFKDGGNLPQIPPLKGLTEIKYKSDDLNVGASAEWAFNQNKLDEFEEPTDGYFVLNLFIQYSIIGQHNTSNLGLNIDNILNTEYRNHLSRVKSILPEAGINFRLSYKQYFHL